VTNLTILAQGGQRLYSLDKLKAICAFLIVCIHAPFPGVFGEYFKCLTRIAVPIFFIISGYFYTFTTVKEQIIKVLRLVIICNLGYFVLGLANAVMRHNLTAYVTKILEVKKLVLFILVNQSPFAIHLWYLGAILYVYVLFYLAEKCGWKKWIVVSFPVFLLLDLILGKYSLLLFHREFPVVLVRNWLFVGIPFFSIGILIKNYKCLLNQICKKWTVFLCILLFSITSILERWFLVLNQINATRDQYISTAFLAISVFLFFLYFVDNQQNTIAKIGLLDSTWVYVIHYALIMVFGAIMRKNPQFYEIYTLGRPIIIFVLSVLLVEFARKGLNVIQKSATHG